MKKFKLLAILASLAILFGCSSGGSSSDYKEKTITPGTIAATKIEMEVPDVDEGESGQIFIYFEPEDAAISIYCDTDIADFKEDAITVDKYKDGARCTVPFKTTRDGNFTFYAESESKLESKTVTVNPVIKSLEIKGSKAPIDKDKTIQLSATTNHPGYEINWNSSNSDIATVENGLVTANAPGKVTITASTKKKPNSETDNTMVTATFEVTVKGFFLNDTSYFLYSEKAEETEPVIATIIGIDDYKSIEWISSNPSLFTIVGTGETVSLKYVSGTNGDATLTAILKDTKNAEIARATADVYIFRFEMVALGDSIAAGYAAPAMGGDYGKDTELEETEFLNAYTKYVKRRAEGSTDFDYVNEYAHPAVLASTIKKNYNLNVRSYAKSGDQTVDLIEKLKPGFEDPSLGTRKGEILDAVDSADIITLCIGANDILHHAMGSNIISKTPAEFDDLLKASYETFKGRFDEILKTLTANGQYVYVMTIYNPYKYFNEDVLTQEQINEEVLFGYVTTKKILAILPVAIKYLDLMNTYIKSKESANVTVIDVAAEFDGASYNKDTHHKYINVYPQMFSLTGLISTFGQSIPIWFDPHPRIIGQERIAELFAAKMNE